VGAVDWDRRLFDSLIPLPDGTSYNSYLVQGSEKTTLIETVDPTMQSVLFENLAQLGIERLDYIVTNHAEQDHSGTLPIVLGRFPEAKVVCTPKCKPMLVDLALATEERIITVEDGETLSLGDKTLEFIHAPWVHWPETMLTYLPEAKILFSCDLFGSHLATTDVYVRDEWHVYEAAKRYYAEIMMPFRTSIQKHLARLKNYAIDIIAPSHGPAHWAADMPKNIVVLPYVSMHGSTLKMVEHLVDALVRRGVKVELFDLSVADVGKLAEALVDAATIVIGVPTVHVGPHPNVAHAAFLANALRPKLRFAAIIGSYGWGSKAVEQLTGMIPNLKVEVLDTVIARGFPREAEFQALDGLAEKITRKHGELNLA
jgi:flavorubredoxin